MEWYYILGMVSYGIFILRCILSFLGIADTELDVDFDGDVDFDVSDLLSFKGALHFVMGFSGWLMIIGKINTFTIIAACAIGVVFMVVLYFVYRLCMRFNSEPTRKEGKDLIGRVVTVYCPLSMGMCSCAIENPDYVEIICKANRKVKPGEVLKITSYEDGIYYIS